MENNRKLVLEEQYPNNRHHRKRKLRERNNGRNNLRKNSPESQAMSFYTKRAHRASGIICERCPTPAYNSTISEHWGQREHCKSSLLEKSGHVQRIKNDQKWYWNSQ